MEFHRTVIPVADFTHRATRRERKTGCRLLAAPALLCAALILSACGNMAGRFETATPTPTPKPNRTVAQTPASEREHERIHVVGRDNQDAVVRIQPEFLRERACGLTHPLQNLRIAVGNIVRDDRRLASGPCIVHVTVQQKFGGAQPLLRGGR